VSVNMQKIEAPNWTEGQVREIIGIAWAIADDHSSQPGEYIATFEQACQLLGQKSVTFVALQAGPALDLNGLLRP
jgi:hypothetical protein